MITPIESYAITFIPLLIGATGWLSMRRKSRWAVPFALLLILVGHLSLKTILT